MSIPTKCHFIGIGGIGMSGLAKILLGKNISVSGSDIAQNKMTDSLSNQGATIYIGHAEKNIEAGSTVVYSTGIKKDNPEYLAALDKKCQLIHRSDLLYQMMQEYRTLAVAGTHGKTTTSALLTAVMKEADFDPSFAVGGVIPQLETNAALGRGDYFIAEADESDGTFLKYHPYGAILTNIGLDHMDYFGAIETLISAFKTFIAQVKTSEFFFWCGDDHRLRALSPAGVSYGFGDDNQLRVSEYRQEGWKTLFDLEFHGKHYQNIELALVGRHNVLNAAAIFGLALKLGAQEEAIRSAFKKFGGVARRCEHKGTVSGVLVLDDYAHHPEEIQTTLRGIRGAVEERRLIAVMQPHRYSRTRDCLGEYGKIFNHVDQLYVTDVYGAGETPIPGISHQQIIDEVKGSSNVPVSYIPRESLLQEVSEVLRPHDVVVTLGAGDITALGDQIVEHLRDSPARKWKVGLLFGGRSGEHEISLLSAKYIRSQLREEFYEVVPLGITREGSWLDPDASEEQLNTQKELREGAAFGEEALKNLVDCDILFPVMHGPFGEDGTIQGFFEMLGKPYVGCSHRSSSVAMDKALAKRIILLNGLCTPHFVDFTHYQWKHEPDHIINLICQQLEFPLFVKPLHLGSTIGITKVTELVALRKAIEFAFKYDHKVLVESGINGRELEFAVFGNEEVKVLPPGEILTNHQVYDYESKYGQNACGYDFSPDLSEELIEEGMFLAEKAYQAIQCTGLARVDFFLDETDRFWFNEINPMPGFTPTSMYPKALEANGCDSREFIDRLIRLGFQRSRASQNCSVAL